MGGCAVLGGLCWCCQQLVVLLVPQLWGSSRALEPTQTLRLGRLVTQLGEPELRELLLPDWGALSALGELDGWSPEQVRLWGPGGWEAAGPRDGLSPRCGPWFPPSCGSVGQAPGTWGCPSWWPWGTCSAGCRWLSCGAWTAGS